jgi:hypothetical protein
MIFSNPRKTSFTTEDTEAHRGELFGVEGAAQVLEVVSPSSVFKS